ncbi:MAG: IS1634 family transposase [Candidatus Brocadiales bacterium]|nr:IS1634 family transposase [Candidatus Brocadiales bacterium]
MMNEQRTLKRHHVGALPLLHAIAKRLGLRDLIERHVPKHGNDQIPVADTLILLSYNLAIGKIPFYELAAWVQSIDLRTIGYSAFDAEKFNDDRFGRSLVRLYSTNRAVLMTELVIRCVQAFQIELQRIHNDSTSVKACGKYPGKTPTGFELKHGKSKDHRPDLKQLIFSLSVSADGAIPVHYKTYPGNRTDDTTHIETWKTLLKITAHPDFLYVADSKLCTDEQLFHISGKGGRAITIMPGTWSEVKEFKNILRTTTKTKKEIWRRKKTEYGDQTEYYSAFTGQYLTRKRGYRIHWIYSSEKRQRDRANREARLSKAEQDLMKLNARLNKRNLKEKDAIDAAALSIVEKYDVANFLGFCVSINKAQETIQIGQGRPGNNTRYKTIISTIYSLTWTRNLNELKHESGVDGVFPLVCTDVELTAKEVLKAYKYQPRLEKRFNQFKSYQKAAPLLFKDVKRIEANFFIFFISLMLHALIEREVRSKMELHEDHSLLLYPEEREADRPTTNKIIDVFESVSTYSVIQDGKVVEEFKDSLTSTQLTILRYLDIPEREFWSGN